MVVALPQSEQTAGNICLVLKELQPLFWMGLPAAACFALRASRHAGQRLGALA